MSRWLVSAAFITAVSAPFQLASQNSPPPVISESDVFTQNVHIIQSLPVVSFDAQTPGAVYVFDNQAQQWHIYAYPRELTKVDDFQPRTNGTWLLTDQGGFFPFSTPEANSTWIFDPKSGTFTHPQSVCGTIKDLPGEGKWLLFQDSSDNLFRLCNTDLGQSTPPLPKALQPDLCPLWQRPVIASPDQKWLLFTNCKSPYTFYAYEIATSKVNNLGTNQEGDDENVSVKQWADNTHPIIYSDLMMNFSIRTLAVANVTQPDSLRTIFSADIFGTAPVARYVPSLSSYLWVPSEFSVKRVEEDCKIYRFDLRTLKTTIESDAIPNVCGLTAPIPDGSNDWLYLSGDYTMPSQRTLVRFNPKTGKSSILPIHTIHWLESVSPNGSYAEMLAGGTITQEDQYGVYEPSPYPFEGAQSFEGVRLAVIDLRSGQEVYSQSVSPDTEILYHNSPENILPVLFPQLQWLTDNTFALTEKIYPGTDKAPSYTTQIIHIQGSQVLRSPPIAGQIADVNQSWLVLRTETAEQVSLSLYNLKTGKTYQILENLDNRRFSTSIKVNVDGSLDFTLFDASRITEDYPGQGFVLRHWIIQVVPTAEF